MSVGHLSDRSIPFSYNRVLVLVCEQTEREESELTYEVSRRLEKEGTEQVIAPPNNESCCDDIVRVSERADRRTTQTTELML